MSRVSKRLRHLAFSREVWFALISDLRARSIIDYVPGERLEDLTVSGLVDLAQRTVHGPRSFSTREASTPVFAKQIFLNPSFPADVQFSLVGSMMLLPGARFLLCSDWDRVRCWSVDGDRLFWEYEGHWNSRFTVMGYDAEVTESGRVAMIAVVVAVTVVEGLHYSIRQIFVDVVHLDLVHGTSFSVFLCPVTLNLASHLSFRICGDFVLVQTGESHQEQLTLLKLSTQSSRTYSMTGFNYKALLIPGYMILVNRKKDPDTLYWKLSFHVWNIDSLMNHCTRRHKTDLKAPPLIHQSIKYPPGRRPPDFFLSAHASPLRKGHYTLWLACPQTPRTTRRLATINKYDVSLQILRSQKPSLKQLSSRTYDLPGTLFQADWLVSYSGHVLRHDYTRAHKICWLTSPNARSKQLCTHDKCLGKNECLVVELLSSDAHEDVQLSSYGGTVTFLQGRQFGIQFYK